MRVGARISLSPEERSLSPMGDSTTADTRPICVGYFRSQRPHRRRRCTFRRYRRRRRPACRPNRWAYPCTRSECVGGLSLRNQPHVHVYGEHSVRRRRFPRVPRRRHPARLVVCAYGFDRRRNEWAYQYTARDTGSGLRRQRPRRVVGGPAVRFTEDRGEGATRRLAMSAHARLPPVQCGSIVMAPPKG